MSRKKFTLVPYGVVGDFKGQSPLALPGHRSIDEVRELPEIDGFARAHSELPVVFSTMTCLLCPPGSDDVDPLEDADGADLAFLRAYLQENGTVAASSLFAWTGSKSSVILDYCNAHYTGAPAPEEPEEWDGQEP